MTLDKTLELFSTIDWCNRQTNNTENPPFVCFQQMFDSLSLHEETTLQNYNFQPKLCKSTGLPLPVSFTRGWGAHYLKLENQWVSDEFIFLKQRLELLPFYSVCSRIALMSLETNGYVAPHSDYPVCQQIAIPLITNPEFHLVWENHSEEPLKQYRIYLINIRQQHAVYNLGPKRIFINCTVDKTDNGDALTKIFNQFRLTL